MSKCLTVGALVFIFLAGTWLVIANPVNENALHDANAIYSLLADHGGETKRITADENGNLNVNINANQGVSSGYSTLIANITLDDNPTSITSAGVDIGKRKKVSFLISYNETEVGNAVSGTFTIEVSPDNSTWIDYDIILDENGYQAPQSSLSFTVDDEDVCYLPEDFTAQYIRVTFAGTNTDADDTILINVWLCWQN